MRNRFKKASLQYETMAQLDVPQGRNGKHKQIVSLILNDLNQLKEGCAIKVPLAELAKLCKGAQKTWADGRNFTLVMVGYEGSGVAGYARSGAKIVWDRGRRGQERDCQAQRGADGGARGGKR